jgi:hypothetical protein
MTKKSPIQWTTKQKQAAELLQQGVRNTDIAKQLGVAKSLVTKVSKVIKKGFIPSYDSYEAKKAAQGIASYPAAGVEAPVGKHSNEATEAENTQEQKPESMALPVAEPTLARLTVTPVAIPLTPVMYSAKEYLVQRKNWSEDVRWEDIIDTIFAAYFKSIGVVLRGWYEEEPVPAPKPARVEEKGDGDKDDGIKPDTLKQLADMVTLQIIELANQGKLAS